MKHSITTCLAVLILLVLVGPAAEAQKVQGTGTPQEMKDDWGRQKLMIPGLTERGNWSGTWFYISRDYQVALWLNEPETDGKKKEPSLPEIKVRLFRLGGGEQFVTDWTGHAEYNVRGAPASFTLKLIEGDENALMGDWDWNLDFANSSRGESAKIKLYRTGDGRRLTLHFDDFTRVVRRGAEVNEFPLQQVWVFRKASKRIVDWTELPF